MIEIVGPVRELRVGGRVHIETRDGERLEAEIIGFATGHALCLPFGSIEGVRLGCKAVFAGHDGRAYPTSGWLGRVVNAKGEPIDGKGPLPRGSDGYLLKGTPLPAHLRDRVGDPWIWAFGRSTPLRLCAKASAWHFRRLGRQANRC